MKKNAQLPPYMIYPRFLMELELSDTAKIVYVLLLDRTRLSMKHEGWSDEWGNLFVHYTVESLAADIHRCPMTVKTALRDLEKAGLVERFRQGVGRPNRIYINCPTDGKNAVRRKDRFLSPRKEPMSKNDSERYDSGNEDQEDSL